MIKGITVTLYEKTKTGVNSIGEDVYTETATAVENVLVAPSETAGNEVLESLNLTGRKAVYILGIPKGDTHDWVDVRVDFFGQPFHTIGEPTEGIEDMIPLDWNKKVRVEMYGERSEN